VAASRREQTSLESRSILISAAAELFAEKGFRNTTFVDIAERSGISRGSIPWHFGNKDGLLKAVVEELTTNMLTDTAPPAGIDIPAVPRVTRAAAGMRVPMTAEAGERHREEADGAYGKGECIKIHAGA